MLGAGSIMNQRPVDIIPIQYLLMLFSFAMTCLIAIVLLYKRSRGPALKPIDPNRRFLPVNNVP